MDIEKICTNATVLKGRTKKLSIGRYTHWTVVLMMVFCNLLPINGHGQDFDVTPPTFMEVRNPEGPTLNTGNPFSVLEFPVGITFSNDGMRMFILEVNSGDLIKQVTQYNLSTAFDVTTASFTRSANNPFSVRAQEESPTGIAFSNDGMRMFIVGVENNEVHQYELSSAFDVTTASFTPSANNPFSVVNQEGTPTGIEFSSNGMRMFILGTSRVHQYELDIAFDVTTASFTPSINNPFSTGIRGRNFTFSSDGSKMFIVESGITAIDGDEVHQYELGTAFDVTTASFIPSANNPFSVTIHESRPSGVAFSNDGRRMFIIGTSGNEVNQYGLTSPFDITTASFNSFFVNPFSVFAQLDDPSGITFSNDGMKMFIVGGFFSSAAVHQYNLTIAFDVTTATFSGFSFLLFLDTQDPSGIAFSKDGRRMFILDSDLGAEVDQYELESAFDITTASFTPSTNNPFSVDDQERFPSGIAFSNDGRKMFIVGGLGPFTPPEVNQYELSSAFDVRTARFIPSARNPFSLAGQESNPKGITFSSDGRKMFIVGNKGEDVNQYELSFPFEVSTARFTPSVNNPFSISDQEKSPSGITFSNDGRRMFIVGIEEDEVNQYEFINNPNIVLSNNSVNENTNSGTLVGTLSITDLDAEDSFNYSISGMDAAFFQIGGTNNDKLQTAMALDFETQSLFNITITATNNEGNSLSEDFTIIVNDVNEIPVAISLSSNALDENNSIGAVVGTLSTTDEDAGDSFTYSILGRDDAYFQIGGVNNDELQAAAVFNFETQSSFSIGIITTDRGGASLNDSFIITINNVNDIPAAIELSNNSVNENAPSGTMIGSLTTTDEDVGDSFTYDISGTDASSFQIGGVNNDELQTAGVLDFETQNSFSINIITTDYEGASLSEELTVTVNNVNDAPTAIELSANAIDENTNSGTAIGSLSTTDEDVGDSFTYVISGTDASSFQIGGVNNDELQTAAVFDFETQSSFNIIITSNDGEVSFSEEFIITVNNVNDAPIVTNALEDLVETSGFSSTTLELDNVFADDDNDILQLSATSSSEGVVLVEVNGTTLTITEVGPGISTVVVTANDGNGGSIDNIFEVTVNQILSLDFETFDGTLKVFPNPVSKELNVRLNSKTPQDTKVTLVDLSGTRTVLLESTTQNLDEQIDVSNLSGGVYILQVEHGGESYSARIVKE